MVKPRFKSATLLSESAPSATTVSLSEVLGAGMRFEASAFDPAARAAIDSVKRYKHGFQALLGPSAPIIWCSTPFRMKRVYVDKANGHRLFSSSDIINIDCKASAYISKSQTKNVSQTLIKKYDVMVSRSGTIGNIGFAGDYFEGSCLTEDCLRLRANSPAEAGFAAAFLRSEYGRLQLTRSTYGSVIQHIEPSHIAEVLVPKLHPIAQAEIGNRFVRALELRDEALRALDQARDILMRALDLTSMTTPGNAVATSYVKLSELVDRFEAHYHSEPTRNLESEISARPNDFVPLNEPSLKAEVLAVTKFRKRVYVKGDGIPLYSSKSIFQIDPIEVKRLGRGVHEHDLAEIGLRPGMVLVTCSGTIGNVLSVCDYMDGWAVNQHAIRLNSEIPEINSLIYAWLSASPGNLLVTRNSYGSVILEIDRWMVRNIAIPRPETMPVAEIHTLVSQANRARTTAWELERSAIQDTEDSLGSVKS